MTLMISAVTIDDLLHEAITQALTAGEAITPTKGAARDLIGVTLELENPYARLSRSATRGRVFSCLGELCWYLSGSNALEPIAYYISHYANLGENGHVHGGYGPRLFNWDSVSQVHTVIDTLKAKPHSRQAVIQLFDHSDLHGAHLDVPCTCSMQFLIRGDALQLVVYMRSNDIHFGLPHDVFAFTMLQELVARSLGIPVGRYIHIAGSLHLYEKDLDIAQAFLDEGWQATDLTMPPMPEGDPWAAVSSLLEVEAALRRGETLSELSMPGDPYWDDLARLLVVFTLLKRGKSDEIRALRESMDSRTYDIFISDKVA